MTDQADPFEQLVDNCRIALGWVEERVTRAGEAIQEATEARERRLEQRARVLAAIEVLTAEEPPKQRRVATTTGAAHGWSEERRQKQAATMRATLARKAAEAAERPAPLDETALDVSEVSS